MSSTGPLMAAIVIRAHESKTPGEDLASEERKGRWRELPCPLTIKGFHVAGSLACPGCMRVRRAVDRSLALPPAKLQSGKGSRKSLPCQFPGKAPPFWQHLVKQVNGVVFNLFLFLFLVWERTRRSFHKKKTSIILRDTTLKEIC